MSSASPWSATRLRMKLRSRPFSRSIVSEIRWSCSAISHCFLSASSIYWCRRMGERNILEDKRKVDYVEAEAIRISDLDHAVEISILQVLCWFSLPMRPAELSVTLALTRGHGDCSLTYDT